MVHPLPQIVRPSLLPLRLPRVLLSPPLLPSPLIFPPANREASLPLSTAPLFLFYSLSIFFSILSFTSPSGFLLARGSVCNMSYE